MSKTEVFVPFTVASDEITCDNRARGIISEYAAVGVEKGKEHWKPRPSTDWTSNGNDYHQFDHSAPSSMASTMPSAVTAILTGNPFPDHKGSEEANTKAPWRPYQGIPHAVWAVLSKSDAPMTVFQILDEINKLGVASPDKWRELTVSDSLRELARVGLAARTGTALNKKVNTYRANDPASIPLSEEGKAKLNSAEKTPAKRAPRKPASK